MMMTSNFRRYAAKGFTLIELLIVVIIIAILAAIAIPQFSNTSSDAQEAALDANLSTVRSAIELYRVQHGNKYPSKAAATGATTTDCKGTIGAGKVDTKEAFIEQLTGFSNAAGATCSQAGTGFIYGPYLRTMPAEPISNKADVEIVTAADAAEPAAVTAGWRFNNTTGKFQANSNAPGRDTNRLLSAH